MPAGYLGAFSNDITRKRRYVLLYGFQSCTPVQRAATVVLEFAEIEGGVGVV
ncbi:hypothetical protein [Pyrobaculum aerophilum]|uniref:hypothetical protein n=1 Tax=Pyrobaculum aerophilum TaxID=13773 RepID=UPI0015F248C7|nr:hypothetical protein [Pyrobaculum aerophilum]